MTSKTGSRRQLWLTLHRWLGAVAAVFLIVVALTGSSLVFIEEMVELQVGEPASASAEGDWRPPDVLIDSASIYAGPEFDPIALYYPDSLLRIGSAFVYGKGGRFAETKEEEILVFVDAIEGRALAAWKLESLWADLVLHLHWQLLAGQGGAVVIAVFGITLIISAVTGIILWWPRRSLLRKLKVPTSSGKMRKTLFDLHGFIGIYFAVAIALLAFSGSQTAQPQWFSAIMPADLYKPPQEVQARFVDCANAQPSSSQLQQVLASYPDRRPSYYNPSLSGGPAHLRLKASDDFEAAFGDLFVWMDCSGESFASNMAEKDVSSFASLVQPAIHSGRIGGLVGRILVFFSGFALALLAGTGLYLFLKARLSRSRKARSSRTAKGIQA